MNAPSRRQFLKHLATLGIATPATANAFLSLDWLSSDSKELWLSAQGRSSDQYGLGWIQSSNSMNVSSGFRGHGLSQNPMKPTQVIMFARRPGTQGIVLNIESGKVERTFHSPANHHMHGHGCFSSDGQYLFCAESNIDSGLGVITVRDTQTFKLISQFSSYGIGPHEIAIMPNGKSLVVANGGLLTHPNSGRKVLNLDTMRSTLSYLDIESGKLENEFTVNESKASIRHLDVAADGTVAIAMQLQRVATNHTRLVSLAALHHPHQTKIEQLQAPEKLTEKLNDYMGSVRVNHQTRTVGFTSPRGNMALFWNLDNHSLQSHHLFHDVCGLTVSADQQYFVLSNSAGKIRQIDAITLQEDRHRRQHFPNSSWDNHMITVSRS